MIPAVKSILIVSMMFILVAGFTTPLALGDGKPDNCDNTAYQAHPGYSENQALWDGYMSDTDGVCQTRYGTGTPSIPCAHTVQVSVGGNPYYLCWYNDIDTSGGSVIVPNPGVPQVYTYQGKEYYVVTSTDATEDTGNEVCAKVGRTCIGYTVETTDVCKQVHPNAATTSSMDGDKSGVYCNGAPQTNICATKSDTCHECPQCTNTVDCATPIGNLYREMYVECGEETEVSFVQNIINAIQSFFSQIFSGIMSFFGQGIQNITTITKTVTIGPYPDQWACDFYQIPFPGVNKKHVSCPYETPGAAVNDAANEFCRTVMNSAWATAAMCDENGIIVCVHPCETTPAHIIPQRCAFDNDRPRGNQAAPINWCPATSPPTPPESAGRPGNCHDTAYQAHPGYNGNEALWDGYMADSDGVCQTYYGEGIPSGPCAHTVQVSVGGNPYYLCWYNNP
jgi:hypothetical protein